MLMGQVDLRALAIKTIANTPESFEIIASLMHLLHTRKLHAKAICQLGLISEEGIQSIDRFNEELKKFLLIY